MTAKIAEFYSETGFNSVDIPDSLDLVQEKGHRVLRKNNINVIQVDNLYKLSVKGMVEGIARAIDYIIITYSDTERAGYFIADKGYEFRAPDICTFYLELDPYATIGGLAKENELVSGTANRLTVNETSDNTEWYTLMEPFKPALSPTILEAILDGRMREPHNNINILETLVIPSQVLKDNEVRIKEGVDESQLVQYNAVKMEQKDINDVKAVLKYRMAQTDSMITQTKENIDGKDRVTSTNISSTDVFEYRDMRETNLTIKGLYGDNKVITTGTRWWRGDQIKGDAFIANTNIPTSVVNDLRHTGSDSNINSYWSIPAPYIESQDGKQYKPQEETDYGGIDNITSSLLESTPDTVINSSYAQFNLKNSKSKYGQGTQVVVYNPVTGNRLEKSWPEVIDPTITPNMNYYTAPFKIGADIRPDGCPIFSFKYLNRKAGDVRPELWGYCYGEILNGGPWRQIPISGQGTNSALSQLALNQQKEENKWSSIGSGILGLGQLGVGIGMTIASGGAASPLASGLMTSGFATLAGTAGSYLSNSRKQRDQQELLNAQGQIANASLKYSNSNYVRELGYNTFYVRYIMYAEEDLKAFDRFLTLYGYNVGNKKITSDDFNSRPGFNYVRINDIDIISNKGVWLTERVKEQLKAGVRIWHEMPNAARIAQGNKL